MVVGVFWLLSIVVNKALVRRLGRWTPSEELFVNAGNIVVRIDECLFIVRIQIEVAPVVCAIVDFHIGAAGDRGIGRNALIPGEAVYAVSIALEKTEHIVEGSVLHNQNDEGLNLVQRAWHPISFCTVLISE